MNAVGYVGCRRSLLGCLGLGFRVLKYMAVLVLDRLCIGC